MLLLIDIFSINKGRGYEKPILEIIVIERCSTGGFPLEEAYEHFFLNQSVISVVLGHIIEELGVGDAILGDDILCVVFWLLIVTYR